MKRVMVKCLAIAAAAIMLAGCSTSEKTLSYVGDADLDHYKDVVTSIDYPAVNQETPDEVSFSDEPRRIRKPRKDEVWELGLEEAVHTALTATASVPLKAQEMQLPALGQLLPKLF